MLQKIVLDIDAPIVLHNLSIKFGEEELTTNWDNKACAASDIDNHTQVPANNKINQAVSPPRNYKRMQLQTFLVERAMMDS